MVIDVNENDSFYAFFRTYILYRSFWILLAVGKLVGKVRKKLVGESCFLFLFLRVPLILSN